MLDHMALQCDDVAASRRFFEHLLQPLGITVAMDFGEVLCFAGPDGQHYGVFVRDLDGNNSRP
jgi:catechol 2,3-dioxygenase-like lactoylglutathione lyase family enzyme